MVAVGSRAIKLSPIVGYLMLGLGLSAAEVLSDSATARSLAVGRRDVNIPRYACFLAEPEAELPVDG
jgi:hypothetical protein